MLKKHLTRCSIKKYNDLNNIIIIEEEEKKQDNRDEIKLKLKLAELEVEKIKLEQIKEEKEILQLKLKTKKSTKTNIKNINNLLNSNNTTNNNVINNFQIIACGKEQLIEALTENEKKSIIRSRFSCLEKIVDIVHCGKYNQFKNIIITNLKDDFAYKYDENLKKFTIVDKDTFMSELIDNRLDDIREIYDELATTNKIEPATKKLIQEFLEEMDKNEKYIERDTGVSYKTFRAYGEHRVKILIYNNADKISKDLTILLDNSKNNTE